MATLDIGHGRFGRAMTEEDSEPSVSELQVEEENELSVIQLCGLVEELRYWPAGVLTV